MRFCEEKITPVNTKLIANESICRQRETEQFLSAVGTQKEVLLSFSLWRGG